MGNFLEVAPKVSPHRGKVGKPKPTKMNTAIVFDHRGRSSENGPIEIRVSFKKRVYYINTGVRVKKRNFVGGTIIPDYQKKKKFGWKNPFALSEDELEE